MTLEECANKVIDACLPLDFKSKLPEQQGRKAAMLVFDALRALVYAESVRAAAVLTKRCNEIQRRCCDGDNIARVVEKELQDCQSQILATSPGNAGG